MFFFEVATVIAFLIDIIIYFLFLHYSLLYIGIISLNLFSLKLYSDIDY